MTGQLTPYLSSEKISKLVDGLADQIDKDYGKLVTVTAPLITLVTLKGALFFASDLLRKLSVPVHTDFIRVSSYGDKTQSSGTVTLIKDIETSIENHHVLVIEDIIDTGYTVSFLMEFLTKRKPASIKLCGLLNKPSRRLIPLKVDYCGADVEDKFLVGYGLDFGERYRNLPEIYSLD